MNILISDIDQTHANTCKSKIEEECPTVTATTRLESLSASVTYSISNDIDIISRSTTGLSDSRNENEGDTAWAGIDEDSVYGSAVYGTNKYTKRVGIVHALGSNSHVRDTDPSYLDIISAISGGGAGNCVASYGPGLEFFHDDETTQSYSTARIAGIIGQMMIDHPSWNFHDCRMVLRQTASFYSIGWKEDGGYGAVDKTAATAVSTIAMFSPTRVEYTVTDGNIVFTWENNKQSDSNVAIASFSSEPSRTDTPESGEIIYTGVLETVSYDHHIDGTHWFVYYSRDSSLNYSLIEDNVESDFVFDKEEIDLEYTPRNINCTITIRQPGCTIANY